MAENVGNGNGNGHDVGPSVIELELMDEVQNAQLVTKVTASWGSKSVILGLNHKYGNRTIEFYPIEAKKWKDTMDRFEDALKANGVDGSDCIILRHLLDYNSLRIIEHFSEQSSARPLHN